MKPVTVGRPWAVWSAMNVAESWPPNAPPSQTGVATGMNTVMRTLGGAFGGQLSATFIADHTAHGLPTVTGFTETYVMATFFLVLCVGAGLLVPRMTAQAAGPSPTAGLATEAP